MSYQDNNKASRPVTLVKLLLEHGARDGEALGWSSRKGHNTVKLLLEHGARDGEALRYDSDIGHTIFVKTFKRMDE